jgi:outer membrane protein assembly factor BamB
MDHHLYAIDTQTGKVKWKTDDLGGSTVGTPAYSPDGILYTGTFNSEMLAINAENGRIRWQVPTDGWVWGGPALKDGKLYFGDLSGTFYAMDAANGAIDWKIKPDGPIAQSPLLAEEAIYFTTQAGSLYAIEYNGNNRWEQTIGGKLYTSPALAGDKILVAPTGIEAYLIAFDINGTQVWQFIPEKK